MHLAFADERLDEAAQMADMGKAKTVEKLVARYVDELQAASHGLLESDRGRDPTELIEKLGEHLARHQALLERVLEQVPETAKPAIERAMAVSRRGQERAIEAIQQRGRGASKPEAAPGALAPIRFQSHQVDTQRASAPGRGRPYKPRGQC